MKATSERFTNYEMEDTIMRSSEETYCKVADRCSEYESISKDSSSNSTGRSCERSCQTCTHFAADEHCRLDLYDKIVKSL